MDALGKWSECNRFGQNWKRKKHKFNAPNTKTFVTSFDRVVSSCPFSGYSVYRGRSSNLKYINMFMRRVCTHIDFIYIFHLRSSCTINLYFVVRRQFFSLSCSLILDSSKISLQVYDPITFRCRFIFFLRIFFSPKEISFHFS